LLNQYGSTLQTVPEQQKKKSLQSTKQIKLNLNGKTSKLALELSQKHFQTNYKGGVASENRNLKNSAVQNSAVPSEQAVKVVSESPMSQLPRRQIDFSTKSAVQLDPTESSTFDTSTSKQFPVSLKNT